MGVTRVRTLHTHINCHMCPVDLVVNLNGDCLAYLCWVDGTRLFAKKAQWLHVMVAELREGLEKRACTCAFDQV